MYKNLCLISAFLLGTLASYCQDTVMRELPPFSALRVTDNITVQLFHTGTESVSIRTEGIDPGQVQTMVENNTLKIGLAGSVYSKQKILVNVNFKMIREMDIRNNAEVITTSLFKADSLNVILKLGGSLYLDADIGYLKSNVSGGGLLTAEGYATRQDIYVSSRATLSAFNLESEIIHVEASSGGKAKISVESELVAKATTGSYISYKGDPETKNISASPGAEIIASEE
jgi:hypothetical protein